MQGTPVSALSPRSRDASSQSAQHQRRLPRRSATGCPGDLHKASARQGMPLSALPPRSRDASSQSAQHPRRPPHRCATGYPRDLHKASAMQGMPLSALPRRSRDASSQSAKDPCNIGPARGDCASPSSHLAHRFPWRHSLPHSRV